MIFNLMILYIIITWSYSVLNVLAIMFPVSGLFLSLLLCLVGNNLSSEVSLSSLEVTCASVAAYGRITWSYSVLNVLAIMFPVSGLFLSLLLCLVGNNLCLEVSLSSREVTCASVAAYGRSLGDYHCLSWGRSQI